MVRVGRELLAGSHSIVGGARRTGQYPKQA